MQLRNEQNRELFQTTGGYTRQQIGRTTTWIVDLKSLLQTKLGLIMHGCGPTDRVYGGRPYLSGTIIRGTPKTPNLSW